VFLLGAVCGWGQIDVSEEVAVCCPGGFTRDRALTAARSWADREKGQVKLLHLTDDPSDLLPFGTSSDRSAETANAEFRVEWLRKRRLALFLQTSKGSAIDFWDGRSRTFERRLLSGGNPFWLSETAEILLVHHDRGAAVFWCRTSDGSDPSVGKALLGMLAALGWMGLPSRNHSRVENICVMDADGKNARCP
jgi:hypothetical protein